MPKFFSNSDNIGIVLTALIVIFFTALAISGAIPITFAAIAIVGTLLFPIARYVLPPFIQALLAKTYGAGINDYWNTVKKELLRTHTQFDFSFKLTIPEYYFPKNTRLIRNIDSALFEINRLDMALYAGEDERILKYPYQINTLRFEISTQKIVEQYPEMTVDDVVRYIEKHKSLYFSGDKSLILPQVLERYTYGDPIETTTPKEGEKK